MKVKQSGILEKRINELKRFCLKYNRWKEEVEEIKFYPTSSTFVKAGNSEIQNGDYTGDNAVALSYFEDRIRLVENCVKLATHKWGSYLLVSVTRGLEYEDIKPALDMAGCSEEQWNYIYERFFVYLNRARNLQGI